MNEEKTIAHVILEAQKLYKASYDGEAGLYKREIESCLIEVGKRHGLSPNLWALLNLTMHWWNDVQLWAEDILAGREVPTGDVPCCDSPGKEKCEQCKEVEE